MVGWWWIGIRCNEWVCRRLRASPLRTITVYNVFRCRVPAYPIAPRTTTFYHELSTRQKERLSAQLSAVTELVCV